LGAESKAEPRRFEPVTAGRGGRVLGLSIANAFKGETLRSESSAPTLPRSAKPMIAAHSTILHAREMPLAEAERRDEPKFGVWPYKSGMIAGGMGTRGE